MFARGWRILSIWLRILCLVRPVLLRHCMSLSLTWNNSSQNLLVLHGSRTNFSWNMLLGRIICFQILGSNSLHGQNWIMHAWCMFAIVHCSLLTFTMQSARYLRLSSIFDGCTSFCVVSFRDSADCATLTPHRSLKSFGVVFGCRSADKKAHGCLMLVGLFGESCTVSMWMYFTSCFVTSLDSCHCCSQVTLFIAIVCFLDSQTIDTSIWLKHCVLNMMSYSSAIWRSSSWIDWRNLMPILDTFRASISSLT